MERKVIFYSLVFLFLLIGVVNAVNEPTIKNFTDSKGRITVNKDDDKVKPSINWIGHIFPNETTKDIFIVIEELLLNENDNFSITVNDTVYMSSRGSKDPFSLYIEAASVNITLITSADSSLRKFSGYYIRNECTYDIQRDSGILSTPLNYGNEQDINCSFKFHPEEVSTSKLSVIFIDFKFNNSVLSVSGAGPQSKNYSGTNLPADIISEEKLVFNFKAPNNGSGEVIKFAYEHVLKESKYVALKSTSDKQTLNYTPNAITSYQPTNQECRWVIESDKNTVVSLKFLNMSLPNGASHIIINNGNSKLSNLLLHVTSLNANDMKNNYIFSSKNSLWISLDENSTLSTEITSHKNGGYFKGSGNITVPSNTLEDVIFLLEVEEGENVLLHHSGNLINSSISIYNDFSMKDQPLVMYSKNIPTYPIISGTSKMMIIAKGFNGKSDYKASFKGVPQDCYRMTSFDSDDYSPKGNCKMQCEWIVLPDNTQRVISLHLHPVHFENDDLVTIKLLDKAQTPIINVTSKTPYIPELYLPSFSGFSMSIIRKNCSFSDTLIHASFDKLKDCNKVEQLSPGKQLEIQSPNYPDSYPLLAHCWTNITSNVTNKKFFHVVFNKLDLASNNCLKLRQNFTTTDKTDITYKGKSSVLPNDMLFEPDLSVEFAAEPCEKSNKSLSFQTASGFSLNITSADCGGNLTQPEGNFSTPGYPNKTNSFCIWIVEVSEKSNVNDDIIYIINYTLTLKESKNYDLKIYDGASVRDELITNLSASSFLSRTNKLIFIYHNNNASQLSDGIMVKYHSQACTKKCQNGICIHDDWLCNGKNDCGDNTDELYFYCSHVPITTPQPLPKPENRGVSPVAFWVCLPLLFVLGILAAIFVPPVYRRFRSGQYHQFRDISADA